MPILIFDMKSFWIKILMPGEDLNLLLWLSWSLWVVSMLHGVLVHRTQVNF